MEKSPPNVSWRFHPICRVFCCTLGLHSSPYTLAVSSSGVPSSDDDGVSANDRKWRTQDSRAENKLQSPLMHKMLLDPSLEAYHAQAITTIRLLEVVSETGEVALDKKGRRGVITYRSQTVTSQLQYRILAWHQKEREHPGRRSRLWTTSKIDYLLEGNSRWRHGILGSFGFARIWSTFILFIRAVSHWAWSMKLGYIYTVIKYRNYSVYSTSLVTCHDNIITWINRKMRQKQNDKKIGFEKWIVWLETAFSFVQR